MDVSYQIVPVEHPEQSVWEIVGRGIASLWHWTQRADCTPTNLSVGCWQIARIFALLRQPANARGYARRCLEYSQAEGVEPVYQAYTYEALARAEAIAGNEDEKESLCFPKPPNITTNSMLPKTTAPRRRFSTKP